MGGFGSGRHSECHRRAVEDMRSVPMSWIEANRIALFRGPQVISWKVGSSSYGSALIELEGAFVRVSYQVRDSEESSWKRVSVLAETMEQPCHFGGVRRWFVCPRCGSKVGTLYVDPDVGCRHCMGLTYWSVQADKMERLQLKKKKIMDRMGGNDLAAPRWMHQTTYNRLLRQYRRAEEKRNELFSREALRILQRSTLLGKKCSHKM